MNHDQPIPARGTGAFDLAEFAKRIVMAGVKARGLSDSERKERVMLARQCGFLNDEETEDYIVLWGLVNA
jgi:hypothetical protein